MNERMKVIYKLEIKNQVIYNLEKCVFLKNTI